MTRLYRSLAVLIVLSLVAGASACPPGYYWWLAPRPATKVEPARKVEPAKESVWVYIMRAGRGIYHRQDCRFCWERRDDGWSYFKGAAVHVDEATRAEFEPCKVCNPPTRPKTTAEKKPH